MTALHLDFETRSTVDLRTAGVDRYAADPGTDIWCAVFVFEGEEDNPVIWQPPQVLPDRIVEHVAGDGKVVAHNVHFELVIWNNVMVTRYGAPALTMEQCDCTMMRAQSVGMPAGLGPLSEALKLPVQKDDVGRRLMLQMARPRSIKDDKPVWWDEPDKVQRLIAYCVQDVLTEIEVGKRIPDLIPAEKKLTILDYHINRRGVYIDMPLVRKAQRVVSLNKREMDDALRVLTNYKVNSANQATPLRVWLGERGLVTPDLRAPTVTQLLQEPALSPDVEKALTIRQEVCRSSLAKLGSMSLAVDRDNRARGLLSYHAAQTGRWGGRRVQPQNLPRPTLTDDQIQHVLSLLETGTPDAIREELWSEYGSVTEPIASCIRSFIRAAPTNEFIGADYSAIEARVLPWLAGHDDMLQTFRDGRDMYKVAAEDIYDTPYDDVTKDQRFIGKIAVLALGYQGGHRAFTAMARAYGVDISKEQAEDIKNRWRESNQAVVTLWYALEEAARRAIRNPGKAFRVGDHLAFRMVGQGKRHLVMRLPSGRYLWYPYARLNEDRIECFGTDTYTRKLGFNQTYGGKLAENATQAVARDVLVTGMTRAEDAGFDIVLHVHDELLSETPVGVRTADELVACMTDPINWADGLPLEAEAWVGERYRK